MSNKFKFATGILLVLTFFYFYSGSNESTNLSNSLSPNIAKAGSGDNVSRWAWSSNIGWISFNSTDCDADSNGYLDSGSCGGDNVSTSISNYGVSIDNNGYFSGYAWSPNIGWIRLDPLNDGSVPCLSGDCRAKITDMNAAMNATSGVVDVIGWARACSVFVSGCSGALNTNTGGWDGWISLSCTNNGSCGASNYKIQLDKNQGTLNFNHFIGFAWGSEVVGWVDFNPLCGSVRCGVIFSSGVTLEVRDATLGSSWGSSLTIDAGSQVEVRADIQGSPTSCSVTAPPGLGGTPDWGVAPPVSGTIYDGGIPSISPTRYSIVCDYSTGSIPADAWVSINSGPQFTLTADPARYPSSGVFNLPLNSTVNLGDISNISVVPSGGFNSNVSLSLVGVYAGTSLTDIRSHFNINITDNSLSYDPASGNYEVSDLTVRISNSVPRSNTYRIVLRGTSGSLVDEITITLHANRILNYQENP